MGLRWEGVDEVEAALEALAERVMADTPRALEKGMQVIEARSVPLVPVLSTDLLDSRRLYETTKDGNPAHAFEYGTEYAIYEHEDREYEHDQGQADFLGQAVREGADEAVAAAADDLGEALG